MKTNDERAAFPFDSEPPGAARFRIKLSRPGTRKLTAATLHGDKSAGIDSHSGSLFPPQPSTTCSTPDGVKTAATGAGHAPEIPPNSLSRYSFIATCICVAAAAFGASAGYYLVSFSSPTSTSRTSSLPSGQNPVVQHAPSASEKMALKIAEMRRIASEESESTERPVEDTKTTPSSIVPGDSMAHPGDGGTGVLTAPGTSPSRQCSAAAMALALCGEK